MTMAVSGEMETWQSRWLERYRSRVLAAAEDSGPYMPELIASYLEECGNVRERHMPAYNVIVRSDYSARRKCELLFELIEQINQAVAFDDFQDALRQNIDTTDLAVTASQRDLLRTSESAAASEAQATSYEATRADGEQRQQQQLLPAAVDKARHSLQLAYGRKRLRVGTKRHLTAGNGRNFNRRGGKLDDVFVDVTIVSDEDIVDLFQHRRSNNATPSDKQRTLPTSTSATTAAAATTAATTTGHVFKQLTGSRKGVRLDALFTPSAEERGDADDWPRRVLVVASAGCGKTVLFTVKAPSDWARGALWSGAFDLLCVVHLRDAAACGARSTGELLQLAALGLTAPEQAEVVAFVHARPERVCLVLDGLDECRVYECSLFVQQVIYDQCPCLVGLRLIVTSRPCIATSVLTQKARLDRRIEVIGFAQASVFDFVHKYLHDQGPGDGDGADGDGAVGGEGRGAEEGMLRELRLRPDLVGLMSVPFLARLACDMYLHTGSLPQCSTEVFESVTLSILQSSAADGHAAFASLDSVPAELDAPLAALSSFAYDMLLLRRLVFGQDELQAVGVSDTGLALGFLVQSDAVDKPSGFAQFRFSHVTLQEFLAALHVRRQAMTPADVTSLVLQIGTFAGQYRTFWQFVAGLVPTEVARALADATLNFSPAVAMMSSPSSAAASPYATQPPSTGTTSRKSSLRQHTAKTLVSSYPSAWERQTSQQRRSHSLSTAFESSRAPATAAVSRPRSVRKRLFRAVTSLLQRPRHRVGGRFHFHDNDISLPPAEQAVVTLRGRSDPSRTIQLMVYGCFHEHAKMMEHRGRLRSRSVTSTSVLGAGRHADAAGDAAGDADDEAIAWSGLERSMAQHGVAFVNHTLQTADCRALGTVLRHHGRRSALRRVSLPSCGLGDDGLRHLLPGLSHCTRLCELHVNDNQLSGAEMPALSAVLDGAANTMETLDVSQNRIGDDGLRALLEVGVRSCRTLRRLYLHRLGVAAARDGGDHHTWRLLNEVMLGFSCLQELWLDGNDVGDAGFAELVSGLQHCERLRVLHAGSAGLTVTCFPSLTAAVSRLHGLEELYLYDNDFAPPVAAAATADGDDGYGERYRDARARLCACIADAQCRRWRALVLPQSCGVWMVSFMLAFRSEHPARMLTVKFL